MSGALALAMTLGVGTSAFAEGYLNYVPQYSRRTYKIHSGMLGLQKHR